jgi:hypothetical protein
MAMTISARSALGHDKGDDYRCNRAELLGINDEASGGKQGKQARVGGFFF